MSNVDLAIKDLKKEFGEIVNLASETPDMDIVSSGSIGIDFATGLGGFPRGIFVEILAEESVGKTSLSYYGIAEAQKAGLSTLFINLEGKLDPVWATTISGLDGTQLGVGSPEPGLETVHFVQRVVHSGLFGYVVLDSVGAMIDDSEVYNNKGKPGKIQPGGAASLVTSMISRTMSYARKNGTTVIFLNQLRDTMGTLYPTQHGPGGRAIKHAASIRIRLKQTSDKIKDVVNGDEIVVAKRISAELIKNKVGPPNAVATYMFYNREFNGIQPGIDKVGEVIDLAMKTGIISQAGAYFRHPVFGEKGQLQGKESVRELLRTNPEAFETVRKELIQFARDKRKNGETTKDLPANN